MLLYIKYSKDKKKLEELLMTAPSFKTVERKAAIAINTITNSKLKLDKKGGDNRMKVCYVNLVRKKHGTLTMESIDEELRMFSSMEKAETWLLNNGFTYGQRSFFRYPENDKEWIHKDDIIWEYIQVEIKEIDIDDLSESKFKNLNELHKEWLPEFLEQFK